MIQESRTRSWLVAPLLLVIGCAGCIPSSASSTPIGVVEVDATPTQGPAHLNGVVPAGETPTSTTPSALAISVHDPETRTGIAELDHIIDVFLAGNVESMRDLLVFTLAGCTHEVGLGGPPKCREEESEGTLVEVFPSLGPEGHFFRKGEAHTWRGPDVVGLYAAYRVSEDDYTDEFYPAGQFGIIFIDASEVTSVVLQVNNGGVVRIDHAFGDPLSDMLNRDAEEVILAPPTSLVANGYIEMPWGIADAGNWFLYATSVLSLSWIDAPAGCDQYEFLLSPTSGERIVIGIDLDTSDGISVDWQVPAGLSEAGLQGEALCSGTQVVPSLHSGILYSGDPPPEGVCVLASGTIGAPDVLREPSISSEAVAMLIPGDFAPVLDHTLDGWYQISTDSLTTKGASESSPDTGWISDQASFKFFGPCDDF